MSDVEQYNAIRASILLNLNTIKSLLTQANSLNQVVIDLDDVDAAERKKLDDNITNIYKSIDLLVIQTDSLFKTFTAYVQSKEGVSA